MAPGGIGMPGLTITDLTCSVPSGSIRKTDNLTMRAVPGSRPVDWMSRTARGRDRSSVLSVALFAGSSSGMCAGLFVTGSWLGLEPTMNPVQTGILRHLDRDCPDEIRGKSCVISTEGGCLISRAPRRHT